MLNPVRAAASAVSKAISLDRVLNETLPKRFRRGTHRLAAPGETLAKVRPFAAQMGITRLGNITGLDRIGIPVAVAVRPNSRSVSVSQGKGLELSQAMASALMEACEGFHAEEVGPLRRVPYRDLSRSQIVVDPATLCAGIRHFDAAAAIGWVQGYDLLRGEPCWVPAEIVHTDYTLPRPDGYFLAGSNGLASGNHLTEAINAAIYELVERDAVALWIAQPLRRRASYALDRGTGEDQGEIRLLLHATDPAYLEQRLGHPASKGCVRILAAMNRFLDHYGILDSDYEQVAKADPRFEALLLPTRAPTPLAGNALVVVDSSEPSRPGT